MANIFQTDPFVFPYLYKFPGQASDERILFLTRESAVLLQLRRIVVLISSVVLAAIGGVLANALNQISGAPDLETAIETVSLLLAVIFAVVGWWWVGRLWKHSIGIVTTKRLVKFISTTPWNRHNLSLPLEMIVDTGAYSKGFLEAFFKLGTFTARSSAASSGAATDDPSRVNKKYFYIDNIAAAEDLHHYVNKILSVHHQDWAKLENFRPFLPGLKGEARKTFMADFPEYWS